MITIKQTNWNKDFMPLYFNEKKSKRVLKILDKVLDSPKIANLGGLIGVVASIIGTMKVMGLL